MRLLFQLLNIGKHRSGMAKGGYRSRFSSLFLALAVVRSSARLTLITM